MKPEYNPGDQLIVLSDCYLSSGRTKGSIVRFIEYAIDYEGVTRVRCSDLTVPHWNYRTHEVRKLTKLERALK